MSLAVARELEMRCPSFDADDLGREKVVQRPMLGSVMVLLGLRQH